MSFPDGADDMPIKSLKVGIEPVQDLHGYDKPWPAGGGKNILDPNIKFTTQTVRGVTLATADGYNYSLSGTGESGSGNLQTNTIPLADCIVYPAGTYTVTGLTIGTYHTDGSWYYNRLGTFTSPEDFVIRNGYREITIGTTYNENNFISMTKGSTAPTAWTPYSNICPITGWDGVKVTRTGKNWFTFPTYEQYINSQQTNSYKNIPIRVKPNTDYYLSTTYKSGFTPSDGFWLIAQSKTNAGWLSIIHETAGIKNGTIKSTNDGLLWLNIYLTK